MVWKWERRRYSILKREEEQKLKSKALFFIPLRLKFHPFLSFSEEAQGSRVKGFFSLYFSFHKAERWPSGNGKMKRVTHDGHICCCVSVTRSLDLKHRRPGAD
jgi:hypothetical protein